MLLNCGQHLVSSRYIYFLLWFFILQSSKTNPSIFDLCGVLKFGCYSNSKLAIVFLKGQLTVLVSLSYNNLRCINCSQVIYFLHTQNKQNRNSLETQHVTRSSSRNTTYVKSRLDLAVRLCSSWCKQLFMVISLSGTGDQNQPALCHSETNVKSFKFWKAETSLQAQKHRISPF